jgi:tetratricopeptide (TPR) repeat protein
LVRVNDATRAIIRLFKQALLANEAGDQARYLELLERCIELDDGTDADVLGDGDLPPLRLRPYIILADELRKRGEIDRALSLLARASERWPADSDLQLHLGACYNDQKDWERAAQTYRASFDRRQDAFVCILLGSVLDELGRHDESLWWLRHTLVVDPDYEEAHYNLGCIDARRGDLDAAEQGFRRAIELDPEYADAHFQLGDLLLTRAVATPDPTAHRCWRPAFEHLSRAAELAPKDERPRIVLAAMHREADRANHPTPDRG